MQGELVSIIVPVYNCENYLDRCLKSLIEQTYKNLEIIIINDGSKDKSLEIIKKYKKKDTRIKLIDKENEGVSIARNIGIRNSNGKYLTFVDADDWLESNAIEIYYDTIIKTNADVVRGNFCINRNDKVVFENNNLYEFSNKLVSHNDINDKVMKHFLLSDKAIANFVVLLFVKADVIKEKVFFNDKLFMMEDVAFYFELFQNIDSIYFLDYPLYHYFENPNSATKSEKKYLKNIDGILDTNNYLVFLMKKHNYYTKEFEKKLNASNLSTIMNYLIFYVRTKKKNSENKKIFINFLKDREDILQNLEIDCYRLSIKSKIAILFFKMKWYNVLYKYLCLYNYMYKLLK